MDIKGFADKIKIGIIKYKYAAIVLVIGLVFLLFPGKGHTGKQTAQENAITNSNEMISLSDILQSVEGAGEVRVLLSTAKGEQTVYQTNQDVSTEGEGSSTKVETVIVTDSQRNESGLITQVNPPTYLGAIVVCQGADSPAVRLAITQAVAKITGLGADSICVLKMK